MRANEFITETKAKEKLRKGARTSLANLTTYDQLNNNNSPYAAYRFGLALACSPHGKMPRLGPIGGSLVMVDYTDADADIRHAAEKIMNVHQTSSTGPSKELPDNVINKNSPVSKPKKNKYGI